MISSAAERTQPDAITMHSATRVLQVCSPRGPGFVVPALVLEHQRLTAQGRADVYARVPVSSLQLR